MLFLNMEFTGIFFVTILPAAMKELSPIETPDNIIEPTPECNIRYNAGYFNTTSAVNAFRFQFTSGNISAGTIYLYGIK